MDKDMENRYGMDIDMES